MSSVPELALEIQLAQGLAGNEAGDRNKTFVLLRKFVRLQLPHLKESLTQDDFTKIWKGIHYRLWMQDKPLVQEKLVDEICGLLFHFPTEEYAMLYIKTFFETESREWCGIDQHRLDKFMMLVREFVNSTFVYLSKSGWKVDLIKQLSVILEETVFNPGKAMQPISLQLHVIDVYPLELKKVVNEQLTTDTATHFFTGFVNIFPHLKNPVVVASVIKLLHTVIFELDPPKDKKTKKRCILDGIEERDATDFENAVTLTVSREIFLTHIMETASDDIGHSKRRKQLYGLVRRIKDLENMKSSKPKKTTKTKQKKFYNVEDLNIEKAAQEYLEFGEELQSKIPSQKQYKKLERIRQKKLDEAEKLNGKHKEEDRDNVMAGEDCADEDIVEMASEFIDFEAEEEEGREEEEDCDFIVEDGEEEEEEDTCDDGDGKDMCEGEEENMSESSLDDEKEETLVDKEDGLVNSGGGDDDDGYDDEGEEDGSDDGLEFDAEEAFLNMEEGGSEEEGSVDDVSCYIVDIQTDNCGGGGEGQKSQCKTQAGQKSKTKKDGASKGKLESTQGKCKRKNVTPSDEGEGEEDRVKKKMKMLMEMMASKKLKTKKKKKRAVAVLDCDTHSAPERASQSNSNFLSLVDFERSDEKRGEICGLDGEQTLVKKKVKNNRKKKKQQQQNKEGSVTKKERKKKEKEEKVDSKQSFPLPTGLMISPDLQVVCDQLKTNIDVTKMRKTSVADKKIKRKLNRYFDMVAKRKHLKEDLVTAVSDLNHKGNNAEFSTALNGYQDCNNKKTTKQKKHEKTPTPSYPTEDFIKINPSPPVFFRNAFSKVKNKKSKRQKKNSKVTSTEAQDNIALQDRKSVSFDMKQNKAFLPETPISSEEPFNSQKKPKTGILKSSPSPILVQNKSQKKQKKKQKNWRRQKAADFF